MDVDALRAALERATGGEFEQAAGWPAPDIIWLVYQGSGDVGWCGQPDPCGDDEPSVPYVRLTPGALELLALLNGPDDATVERVARIMWRDESSSEHAWDDADERDKDYFRHWARAALAAVKEAK